MRLKQLDAYERIQISEKTLATMCDLAAGDFNRSIDTEGIDWEELFQAIGRNGLLAMTHDYLHKGCSRKAFAPEFQTWVIDTHRTSGIRLILMYMKVTGLLSALAKSGIDYMVIKGPALAHLVYPDPTARGFNDLDIMIRERDWPIMHQFLLGKGYISEHNWPSPPPKVVPEAVIYEEKYWHPQDKLMVEVHYDDLLNAGLASRQIEGFWERAIEVLIDTIPVKTLCMTDQLIHLCMHAHYHGYTRLNWFSDIALIINYHVDKIDWAQLLDTVHIEEADIGVYYSLYYLEELLNIKVPGYVMDELCPGVVRQWWHEYYMPASEVLSLQPMRRPDFSFYFRPLFKRFLPDFIVMGRRRDKLRYLKHLLVPPEDWLRVYYKLNEHQSVRWHYLTHPIRLSYHYLHEIFVRITDPDSPFLEDKTTKG